MSRLAEWLDNPVFVKHVRSRLRRRQWLLPLVVVLTLGVCILYGGFALGGFDNGGAFGTLLALQSIVLVIIGAAQVAAAVAGARESGILDFHRVTPQPPAATMLGFFFGAPIREYLLFAATLPFSLFCVAQGTPSLAGAVQILIQVVLVAWLFHAVGMLNALILKKPRAASRGIVGLVLIIVFFSSGGLIFGFTRATVFVDDSPTLTYFGAPLPWLAVVLLYQIPALAFLLIASARKMASERAHALSKPQAVACLAAVTALVLGGCWGVQGVDYLVLVVEYVLVSAAIVLTMTVTPGAGEVTRGLRRAEKMGRIQPRPWEDLATNRVVLAVLCGIVLAGATIAWDAIEGRPRAMEGRGAVSYSLPIAVGVLVVAYFGLALQYFQLRAGKRAVALMGLFLFLAWVVPLVLGAIAMIAGGNAGAGQFLLALSPVVGIALSAGVAAEGPDLAVRAAAVSPALAFAFLFNYLVVVTARRARREIHRAPKPQPADAAD